MAVEAYGAPSSSPALGNQLLLMHRRLLQPQLPALLSLQQLLLLLPLPLKLMAQCPVLCTSLRWGGPRLGRKKFLGRVCCCLLLLVLVLRMMRPLLLYLWHFIGEGFSCCKQWGLVIIRLGPRFPGIALG